MTRQEAVYRFRSQLRQSGRCCQNLARMMGGDGASRALLRIDMVQVSKG